jgi:hypothetical protein
MSRRADIDEFYRILDELRSRVGGSRMLRDSDGRSGWPERGMYFFFEEGEFREDGVSPRVVRIGTHAVSANSKAKLWTRLRLHRGNQNGGGSHRGSIFRLRVGEALIQKNGFSNDIGRSWGTGKAAAKNIRLAEAPLELAVSEYICRMPFLWVAVDDIPGPQSMRSYLEKNSIGLLSNFETAPIDSPSPNWLGKLSAEQKIRESGLWNSDYVDFEYDPAFLHLLKQAVLCMLRLNCQITSLSNPAAVGRKSHRPSAATPLPGPKIFGPPDR